MRSEDIASVFNSCGTTYEESASDLIQFAAARLVERLQLQPGQSFVDLGCGPGTLIAHAEPLLEDGSAIGVDLSSEQLTLARRRFQRSQLTTRFIQSEADRADLIRRSADAVGLGLVLHYADRPVALLSEATRLARPGGRIAATVIGQPFLGAPGIRYLGQLERRGVAWPDLELQFNVQEFAQLALLAGADDRRLDQVEIEVIEREFWWDSFDDWWAMLVSFGFVPSGRERMMAAIARDLREDDRVVDPDGKVRCAVSILLLTAVTSASDEWE